MMPGPVSDSYDPEFSTGANAHDVAESGREIVNMIAELLGDELKHIVSVVQGEHGPQYTLRFSERELRVIRFMVNRALETI